MIADQRHAWTRWGSLLGLVAGLVLAGALLSRATAQPAPSPDLSDQKAQKLFVQGLTQSYLEDYEEAISLFESALEVSPQQPAILSALSEAEAGRNNVTSAIYYARQARTNAPDEPYYYHTLADLLRVADQPAEAMDVYRSLLSRFPNDRDARLALARLQKESGAPREALRTYETLLETTEHPQPQAYAEMLALYHEVGNEEGLERTLKALIDLRRNTSRYRELLGQLYTQQDRYNDAIPLFEALLQERPSNPRLLSRLKMLYTETGKSQKAQTVGATASTTTAPSQLVARARSFYNQASSSDTATVQSAVELLQRALKTAPTQVEALDLLGTIYFEQGRYEAAAPLFQRAINENPRDPSRWRYAATAHLRADSLRQAATMAEEGRLLFPGRYDLTRIEAFSRLRLGEVETALSRFQEARSQMDSSTVSAAERAEFHAGRGHAHQRLGHVQKAHAAYELALRLDAQAPMALRQYPYSLAQQSDRLDRALELAQLAVDVLGATPETLDHLGWVYFKRENYSEAEAVYEKALASGTVSAQLYEHFGDVQHALGNESRAQAYWKKALDRAPDRGSVRQKLNSSPQS